MSERGTGFDAKREAYTDAREQLRRLIDTPDKTVPVDEYRANLRAAHLATGAAHDEMLTAAAAQAWDEGYLALSDDMHRDNELRKHGSRFGLDKATPNPHRSTP